MTKTWPEVFIEFFCNRQSEIGEVLYAEGCREGWLQGEMYRLSSDPDFSVNSYRLDNNSHKIDLYGRRPSPSSPEQEMVAEIKIIGPSFLQKNIDGNNNIGIYIKNEVVNVDRSFEDSVNTDTGSILKDYFRLKKISDKSIEKYLILVIPHYEDCTVNKDLEKALYAITFDGRQPWEWRFPESHFDIRIWMID